MTPLTLYRIYTLQVQYCSVVVHYTWYTVQYIISTPQYFTFHSNALNTSRDAVRWNQLALRVAGMGSQRRVEWRGSRGVQEPAALAEGLLYAAGTLVE